MGYLNQRLPWLASSLIASTFITGLVLSGSTEFLEKRSYNWLHRLRAKLHPLEWDSRIVVITIGEQSLSEYGRFPWSRARYAQLLETLWATQPAAIAFDILMPEATDSDSQFAAAIADSGNVVLAIGSDGSGNPIGLSPSIAKLAEGSYSTGVVNNSPDEDGVSRVVEFNPVYPTLSLATLDSYQTSLKNTQRRTLTTTQPIDESQSASVQPSETLNDSAFPTFQRAWLNWPSPIPFQASQPPLHPSQNQPGPISVSFTDVTEGRVDLSDLQNKILLVGVTAVGMDPMRTPFNIDPPTSGVYLHAAILDNLINQRFLRRLPQLPSCLILWGASMLTGYFLYERGVKRQLTCYLGFPLLWLGLAYGAFLMQWWLPLISPIVAVWLTTAVMQLQVQRDKAQLMNLFAMSVAPETAKVIWQRKQEIFSQGELAAQELTATVLFMDIRGFTTIAESLPSTELLQWLNDYFDVMTDCIMAQGGIVDNYIGDAIMAVFGAPFPRTQPEQIQQDAIAAIKASLAMHRELTTLNQRFLSQGLPTITFGIGIHTGKLVAGTVGNRHRMSYSMFGDTVNMAARIESITKDLPATADYQILLSATTQEQIQSRFHTSVYGSIALRGRGTETILHSLQAEPDG